MENSVKTEIKKLKKEKNAIILAHYYAPADVQELADYVGDSYYLAKVAKGTQADVLVFCGVSFMGESAKILNPDKVVLMPDLSADCPMAHMASIDEINVLRKKFPDLAVVCYINSTAELKCVSDVCVTSSNALKIVKALKTDNIFFIPDENLGRFVASQCPEKNIILNKGCCPLHASVTVQQLKKAKRLHPNAVVLTHPECRKEILELSDHIGSTAEILEYAESCDSEEFIICTEDGVGYPLSRHNPNKRFYFVTEQLQCTDMKLNTPEKILRVLQTGENEITVSEEKRLRALMPLDLMLRMAK